MGDPQAAQRLYDSATEALEREDFARADSLLVNAYEAVSAAPGDALRHRAERDLILAARRETLRGLSQVNDHHEPLCRLRAFLSMHDTALKEALGPSWQPSDSAGVQFRIAEIDEWLAARKAGGKPADCEAKKSDEAREETAPPATAQVSTTSLLATRAPTRDLAPPPSPESEKRANRLQLAGAMVLTGSLLPLGVLGYGLASYTQNYTALRDLQSRYDPNDQADRSLRQALFEEGRRAFFVAIAAGSLTAILIGTGAALLGRSRKLRRSGVDLAAAPGAAGFVWHGRF